MLVSIECWHSLKSSQTLGSKCKNKNTMISFKGSITLYCIGLNNDCLAIDSKCIEKEKIGK